MQPQLTADLLDIIQNLSGRLEVVEKSIINDAVPLGTAIEWTAAASLLPYNYLPADGRAIDRIAYSAYFLEVGTDHGIGDGISTFNIPNRISPPNGGVTVSYVQFTTGVGISATTEASANTVVTSAAVTADGTTEYWVEFFSPQWIAGSAGNNLTAVLYDGISSIGIMGVYGDTSTQAYGPAVVKRKITPSAGSHTYSIRGFINAGAAAQFSGQAGGAGNHVPGYIKVSSEAPTNTTSIIAVKVL